MSLFLTSLVEKIMLAVGAALLLVSFAAPGAKSSLLRHTATSRIIGGQEAKPHQYPFVASIRGEDAEKHSCGGSLIAPNLVLTAAHCRKTYGTVHLGQNRSQQVFEINQEFIHPRYNYIDFAYDFMIIELNGSSTVQPIQLNQSPSVPHDGEIMTVIGWGRTSIEGEYVPSETLREAQVSYVPQSACRNYWARNNQQVTDDMLCVVGLSGYNCQGDSGSPLITVDSQQVGIVAWGPSVCNLPEAPSVYARINDQWGWIQAVVCTHAVQVPLGFNCSDTLALQTLETIHQKPDNGNVAGDPVTIFIVLHLDDKPQETGFVIQDWEQRDVFRANPGTFRNQTQAMQELQLQADKEYFLILLDSGNDGFCCDRGQGYYEVFVGSAPQQQSGQLLLEGIGRFGKFRIVKFSPPLPWSNLDDVPVVGGAYKTYSPAAIQNEQTVASSAAEVPFMASWTALAVALCMISYQ
jgi:V8-like Glu-specific endopeptidase